MPCRSAPASPKPPSPIGAVNTLLFTPEGYIGDNTDALGFAENLQRSSQFAPAHLTHAILLGAGGASRAILHALNQMQVLHVTIANRTLQTAQHLAASGLHPRATAIAWADLPAHLPQASLLINATSLGMQGQPPLTLDLKTLPPDALITDIVYAPLLTPLLQTALRCGNPMVDGLGMLLYQAQPAFAAFFGQTPPVTPALRKAVLA